MNNASIVKKISVILYESHPDKVRSELIKLFTMVKKDAFKAGMKKAKRDIINNLKKEL